MKIEHNKALFSTQKNFYNLFLKKGDSIDIPEECIHYIENETDEDLIFIEIQMGTYFGEDDIIRLEDKYGR